MSIRIRRTHAAAVSAASLLLALAWAAPASAAPVTSPAEQEVRAGLAAVGVDSATADVLVSKLEAGIPWNNVDGSAPVTTSDTVAGGSTVHTETFADGSVIQTKVQLPGAVRKGSTTQAVAGCVRTASGATYFYKGCTASAGDGATSMQFTVDYQKANTSVTGPYLSPQINRIYGQGASNFGGNYTQQSFSIVKKVADTSGSALARYQIKVQFFGAVASKQLNFTLTKAGAVSAAIKQI